MALEYALLGALSAFLAYLMTCAPAAFLFGARAQGISEALSAWASLSFVGGLVVLFPVAALGAVTGFVAYFVAKPSNHGVQATPNWRA